MWKSPIEVIQNNMQLSYENEILKAVQSYDINIDREELVKALAYDRQQYIKGYADAKEEIVWCKDCKHYNPMTKGCTRNPSVEAWYKNDFCSYGETEE